MFVKKRNRWALKSKNRIGQRSIGRHSKRCCASPSIIEDESVASKDENEGNILQRTTYGKLFQASMSLLEDYCANSTLHGPSYFVDKKRHWLERFWWIAGFVMSIFCCGALIRKVYNNWDQRSIIVSISEELTSVWDIPLPAVTICPSNKIPSTEFNFTEIYERWEKHPEIPFNITDEEVKFLLAYNYICGPLTFLVNISDKFSDNFTDNSVNEILWKLAPSLKSTVEQCLLTGFNIPDFKCKLEESVTELGLCFTFNMLNGRETYSIESTHYSQMDHNKTSQWNLENGYNRNISVTSRAYPYRVSGSGIHDLLNIVLFLTKERYERCFANEGFQLALHLPGEISQRPQFKYFIKKFETVQIRIKPKVVTTSAGLRSYHPDRRKCYFSADRKLRFLKLYTQHNCHLECLSNFTLSLCGCVEHFMLRDANTPICGPAKIPCLFLAQGKLVNGQLKQGLNVTEEESMKLHKLVKNCKCWPACNSINYDAEIRRYDLNNRNSHEERTTLGITFEENEFITLTRSEVYGTIDFIASCGGLLGLFVGASFLSVVELLYYCSLRLYCTRLNRKRENNRAISTVS